MPKAKKILIDLGKLKNRFSGLGEVTFNFGKVLSQNISLLKKGNMEVYFLVPAKYKNAFGSEVKYITLNFFRRHFSFLNKGFDLWYATHPDSSYLPGNKKTKFLLTIHDLNFIYKKNKKKVSRRLARIQKKIDRADKITVISNFTKNEIESHVSLDKKPVEIIFPGVTDTSIIKGQRPAGINENENFFFHISTLMPKKNVAVLIEMMRLMPEKKLVIAGTWDSDYAKEILEKIEKEKIKNIITLSKISDEQKGWLMQNCEALFFPSLLEGFGIPVIEAMYCGKPVFASTCTSLPEIGSDKAFYWKNFKPAYMRNIVEEKMEQVNSDPDFASTLKKYASQFTWQNNVLRYIDVFKEILS